MTTCFTFNEICTDIVCSRIFEEMAKFLLYRKEQIPVTFDKLSSAVKTHKCKIADKSKGQLAKRKRPNLLNPSEKLFSDASRCVEVMNEIFDQVANLFEQYTISEIAFFFGGSLLLPDQIYHIYLPHCERGHLSKYHSREVYTSDLLRFTVHSDALNEALSKPMEPTNFFVLLKIADSSVKEHGLIPKHRYKIPSCGHQVHIEFLFQSLETRSCCCKGLRVFSEDNAGEQNTLIPEQHFAPKPPSAQEIWYQVPRVFRGFKDVYVQGVSVSKVWLTSDNAESLKK